MAYVSVSDPTNPNTSPIVGMFYAEQLNPTPPGYIGQISDSDARIATFLASLIPSPSPAPSPA